MELDSLEEEIVEVCAEDEEMEAFSLELLNEPLWLAEELCAAELDVSLPLLFWLWLLSFEPPPQAHKQVAIPKKVRRHVVFFIKRSLLAPHYAGLCKCTPKEKKRKRIMHEPM